jgi:antitoxin MazE
MHSQVQKWGNSLALRIPKSFAAESNIKAGSLVSLSVEKGRLIVEPVTLPEYSLDELLSGINESNLHREVDFGAPQGSESL